MYKYIVLLIAIIFTQISYAETCPKVSEIKTTQLLGWTAYDSDDGKELTAPQVKHFKQAIQAFVLAEWSHDPNKAGSIHCYYRDKSGSNLEAYLAKDNYHPKKLAHHFWYPVSGHMHCAASSKQCEFEGELFKNKQLARN